MTIREQISFLTIPQVAEELEMTRDGVYKLVRRGKLKAVRVSERRMYVSQPALDAYRRRLNGEGPDTRRPESASASDLRAAFERDTGRTPEQWVADWKANRIEDSAESMRRTVDALSLRELADTAERDRGSTGPNRRH
jgi:excisionase family DNA binding protein